MKNPFYLDYLKLNNLVDSNIEYSELDTDSLLFEYCSLNNLPRLTKYLKKRVNNTKYLLTNTDTNIIKYKYKKLNYLQTKRIFKRKHREILDYSCFELILMYKIIKTKTRVCTNKVKNKYYISECISCVLYNSLIEEAEIVESNIQ